jgi:catechol 2,3-dioxygenase-like lactoylglutathione lyase family enzyme
MIDHLKLHATDPARSRAFYEHALAPLGYRVLIDRPASIGMGAERPDFFIAPAEGGPTPVHVAFRADSEHGVDAFHAAALAAGGTDNGAPGPRPQYHHNYYGAFVLDPDGNNVEAVYHGLMQPDR